MIEGTLALLGRPSSSFWLLFFFFSYFGDGVEADSDGCCCGGIHTKNTI